MIKSKEPERMVCFAWCFNKKPDMVNYTYCDTVQECRRSIERQYACTDKDYTILSKQIREVKLNGSMKYYSELIVKETIEANREISGKDKQILKQKKKPRRQAENGLLERYNVALF